MFTMLREQRTINGVTVHIVGQGPAMVLLHANGGDHRDYQAVIGHLAEHATVYAIDWPGHGASNDLAAPSACGFADLLPDLLDTLGAGPYTLVGNSVGGFAALRTAGRRPDLVSALVLVDTGGFTPRWPTTFLGCWLFGTPSVAPLVMRHLPRFYLRTRTPAVLDIIQRAREASHSLARVRTFAAMWRSFTDREHDARMDAAAVAAPVLLIWGKKDPILPWFTDGRRARRALPTATVVPLPCGHQPHAEMPIEFVDSVRSFMALQQGCS
jgi:pimeloyl-ACP methyl ester carboxylesterase